MSPRGVQWSRSRESGVLLARSRVGSLSHINLTGAMSRGCPVLELGLRPFHVKQSVPDASPAGLTLQDRQAATVYLSRKSGGERPFQLYPCPDGQSEAQTNNSTGKPE